MAVRVRRPNGETIVLDAEPETEEAAAPEGEPRYPVPYYNPVIVNERFALDGQSYKLRFANGRFVARDENEERAVRAALAVHGRGRADRWRGDDRRTEWTCKTCGFRTRNDNAKDDHEGGH